MNVRSSFFPLLLSLVLVFPMAAQSRRRAVRVPGGPCSFTLASTIPDPVPDGGITRASVRVSPLVGNCSGWNATSPVSWIQVEHDAINAYVTVLPNEGSEPRSARLTIAGVWLDVTQLGHAAADANLLRNGGFDHDLSNWGWRPEQFPFNGVGNATWTSEDANSSVASGSIRLTDDMTETVWNGRVYDPSYQQVQCVNSASVGAVYDYGFSVRSETPDTVRGIMQILQFQEPDCRGNYEPLGATLYARNQAAGVWESRSSRTAVPVKSGFVSILVVIGGYADDPGTQAVWIDDVFLKMKP